MNKKEIIDRVVKIANDQIGTKETPKGSNINKYAAFFDALRKQGINIYNGPKQGAAYCDEMCDYVYIMATSVEIGPKMIYQPLNGCGAGCKFSAQYYRNNKAFFTTPEVGDQIFYGKDGKAGTETHTGIVVKLTEKTIYTVEGNVSNEVKAKTVSRSQIGKKIIGFGRPNWDYAVKAEANDEQPILNKPSENPPTMPSAPTKKIITAVTAPESKTKAYAKTWKVTTNGGKLRLRQGPGTNFAKLVSMPNKSEVVCNGEHTGEWLFVSYETKAIIYKGFALKKWMK